MEVKIKETGFWNDVGIFWLWLCVSLETEIISQFLLYGYMKVCINNVSLQFYPSAYIKQFLKVVFFPLLFAIHARKVFAVGSSFYLLCKGFFFFCLKLTERYYF